uniref:Uncharacterized protein n=1 Tax=Cacopsylla melanoneura TaxID=428564 RepID=A0A8D9E5W2_9HEMI
MSIVAAAVANALEKYLPLSEQDLEMRRLVYRTRYPGRRLFLGLWIPGIDETESPYFEILYAIEMYAFVLILVGAVFIVTVSTTFMYVQAKYTCLSDEILKIGAEEATLGIESIETTLRPRRQDINVRTSNDNIIKSKKTLPLNQRSKVVRGRNNNKRFNTGTHTLQEYKDNPTRNMLEYDFQCLELKERTDILTSDINKIQVQSVTSQYDEKTRQPNRFVLCEDKHRMFVRHLIQSHQKIIDYETKVRQT